jgi:oxygen-independent coproporphyrinogen-3 oxidase
VANNQQYIKKLNSNFERRRNPFQGDQFNEMIMIGLRTIWGVDLESLKVKFDDRFLEHFQQEIKQKMEEGIRLLKRSSENS